MKILQKQKMNNYNPEKSELDSFMVNRIVRFHDKLKSDEKLKITHGAIIEIVKKNKIEMFFDKIKNKLRLEL